MKLVWTPESVKDLDKIYDYYATKSLRAAAILYNSIIDEAEILKSQPYIAAIEQLSNELPQTFRSLLVSKCKFKVIYYVKDDEIHIVYVWNCRQSPKKLKKRLSKIKI